MNRWINKCHFGDVRDVLRAMIADGVKVNTIVTSPPYWGLRDYGHPGQLGLEPTVQEFIANMTEVFDLARQVLADDGTAWVNMGDCYATGAGKVNTAPGGGTQGERWAGIRGEDKSPARGPMTQPNRMPQPGLKPKDLVGQPWRLAFALQDAGWYLRQDIIWNKPNPMPESVRDRCTKSHEYIFLLSKSERYYFDQEAIKEPASPNTHARVAGNGVGFGHGTDSEQRQRGRVQSQPSGWATGSTGRRHDELAGRYPATPKAQATGGGSKNNSSMDAALAVMPSNRNKRSVWTVPTESFKGAHFATYPQKLIEPCVLAGCPAGGTVLDIFFGSGTTGQVAQRLGRNWIGIEINDKNETLQRDRIGAQAALVLEVAP